MEYIIIFACLGFIGLLFYENYKQKKKIVKLKEDNERFTTKINLNKVERDSIYKDLKDLKVINDEYDKYLRIYENAIKSNYNYFMTAFESFSKLILEKYEDDSIYRFINDIKKQEKFIKEKINKDDNIDLNNIEDVVNMYKEELMKSNDTKDESVDKIILNENDILDKISKIGYENITEVEKEYLKKLSDEK